MCKTYDMLVHRMRFRSMLMTIVTYTERMRDAQLNDKRPYNCLGIRKCTT